MRLVELFQNLQQIGCLVAPQTPTWITRLHHVLFPTCLEANNETTFRNICSLKHWGQHYKKGGYQKTSLRNSSVKTEGQAPPLK